MDLFQKSKLGELLISLSKRERNDLLYFIGIPSLKFKTNQQKFFKELLEIINQKKLKSLDLNELFKKNDLTIKYKNHLFSKFLEAGYQYLSCILNPIDEMPSGYKVLRYFKDKEMERNYKAYFNRLKNEYSDQRPTDAQNSYHKFSLHYIYQEEIRPYRKKTNEIIKYELYLDEFYLENKLRISCEKLSRSKILKFTEKAFPINEVRLLQKVEEYNSPIINVFWNIYQMFLNPSLNEYYDKVTQIINIQSPLFSTTDKKNIYEFLMNFCIIQINLGNELYATEYINHINYLEAEKLLLIKKKITPSRYKNAVMAGLISDNLEWSERFVISYTTRLESNLKKNILNYNLAQIEFQKGNLNKAIDFLYLFDPIDIYYKIGYNKLLLKIYAEQKNLTAVENKISSFKKFVQKNKKLSANNQELLLTFISTLSKLINGRHLSLDDLKHKLPLSDFKWFVKQKSN